MLLLQEAFIVVKLLPLLTTTQLTGALQQLIPVLPEELLFKPAQVLPLAETLMLMEM